MQQITKYLFATATMALLAAVCATHSPVRPNLIAMTRCKIISVKGNMIEIEGIDAFPDTPVLDIKS